MPNDADTAFDRTVLELIEHNPTGAVPRTPAYQDSLTRLRASQQVYVDADHRDGYVTARSLAVRPCYFAANLDAVVAGSIEASALESNTAIFDRYVKGLPADLVAKAETVRTRVAGRASHHRMHGGVIAHDPIHSLFLVPGAGRNRGIAGNYVYGWLLQLDADAATSRWAVHLHDSDDGAMMADAATLSAAYALMQEVIGSAPFHLNELAGLGFRSN